DRGRVVVHLDAEDDGGDEQLRGVGGQRWDEAGDHRDHEQAAGDGRAGIPHQPNDEGERGCCPPDGFLEVAPATAQILWPLWLLRLLDDRVAGQAAIGWAAVRNLGTPSAPHPEHRRAAVSRRRHSHGATLPHPRLATGSRIAGQPWSVTAMASTSIR